PSPCQGITTHLIRTVPGHPIARPFRLRRCRKLHSIAGTDGVITGASRAEGRLAVLVATDRKGVLRWRRRSFWWGSRCRLGGRFGRRLRPPIQAPLLGAGDKGIGMPHVLGDATVTGAFPVIHRVQLVPGQEQLLLLAG